MSISVINLILAMLWLALGISLFIVHVTGIKELSIRFDIAALVLAVYNLVRWWSMRMAQKQRDRDEQMLHRPPLRRASDELRTPDPNFIFTDQPPSTPVQPGSDGIAPEKK